MSRMLEKIFLQCPQCGEDLIALEARPVYYELWRRACENCELEFAFDFGDSCMTITGKPANPVDNIPRRCRMRPFAKTGHA